MLSFMPPQFESSLQVKLNLKMYSHCIVALPTLVPWKISIKNAKPLVLFAECLVFVILCVIILNVIMLSVMAPQFESSLQQRRIQS
jgi:hypothetical protein